MPFTVNESVLVFLCLTNSPLILKILASFLSTTATAHVNSILFSIAATASRHFFKKHKTAVIYIVSIKPTSLHSEYKQYP